MSPSSFLVEGSGLRFPARRICFVLLSGVGDAVHGLPVVNGLKDHDPGLHVTWVAEPAPSRLLTPHPSVDRVVVYHKARGLGGVRELWRSMRDLDFDLALNTQRYFKSVFPTLFSGAPVRVGLDRHRARDGVWLFSTHRLPFHGWAHTQDVYLEFLEYLGLRVDRDALEWRLRITADERRAQERFFDDLPAGPVVSLVLCSANPKKDWPVDRYARLADAVREELGATVLLLGGPSDRERSAAARVCRSAATRPVDALAGDVRRLMWLVEGSDVVVSPDTGPLHIARALEVPVVGLFGHTSPWRVGPYRAFSDLVVDRYTDPGEARDPAATEPRHGRMDRIGVEDVMEKVRLALRRYVPARG